MQMQHDESSALERVMLTDIRSGFVQADNQAAGTYVPRLISNQRGSTMGDALRVELQSSERFAMSVAFVGENALKGMYQTFLDARGGTIITSTKK